MIPAIKAALDKMMRVNFDETEALGVVMPSHVRHAKLEEALRVAVEALDKIAFPKPVNIHTYIDGDGIKQVLEEYENEALVTGLALERIAKILSGEGT